MLKPKKMLAHAGTRHSYNKLERFTKTSIRGVAVCIGLSLGIYGYISYSHSAFGAYPTCLVYHMTIDLELDVITVID